MRRITHKTTTLRRAVARGSVRASRETIDRLRENRTSKPDILVVARVAAMSAVKKTADLIPYCHPVPIDAVDVVLEAKGDTVDITVTVEAVARTGVEMEALTAVSVAALTIYDMLKPDDRELVIERIHLETKTGGRSDRSRSVPSALKAVVVVASDGVSRSEREDRSGAVAVERLAALGVTAGLEVVPDDAARITELLKALVAREVDLVVTTGGTGLGPRDVTAEATRAVIERELPGIAEAIRAHGQARTPRAMLSRGIAGVCARTLIVNLPGSPSGVADSLDALLPDLLHAFAVMRGEGHPPA
ncbi:MAG: bifunctional molybdenum cofactor biosynthesis protein MoaC/MoaB [Candidatus Krumholzibacteria bacterium]|nr:bifunctional molybdenum cofactor biosynthesis protein MoaC/MoaB [Candidatus Krumholzibacteria bacterium]